MANGYTLSSSSALSDMSKIAIAEAIDNVEPAAPTPSLVFTKQIGQGEKQVNVPFWGRVTSAALTEGIAVQATQQMTSTVRQLTATEHGNVIFISRVAKQQNNEDLPRAGGVMAGRSVGRLMSTDIEALFTGFSVEAGPGTGTAAGLRNILGAVSYLNTDNAAAFGPVMSRPQAVLHTEQVRMVAGALTSMSVGTTDSADAFIPTGMSERIIKRYFRNKEPVYGVPIWESGTIVRDSGDDVIAAVFAHEALLKAVAREITAEDDNIPRMRGMEVVTVAEWGELEGVDTWGTKLTSDSAALAS